ncbi:hypothetical protein CXF80_13635 [Shewanella sp. Actino-trap-3]|jgi:hypothetical protein|uniref:hypothetical protein n=1 Tax=Shewanella sp. Actino-trap-3 TaxID=2058331 RepID=UPI000C33FEBA|nr:hypothetical protein [Shewanella sp. Actino-trap-3]PKG79263.1 hypothetical protein CXF80_13635 [Shewanella sp. Actino-trap-3]
MRIPDYLSEVEHAALSLIDAIWSEQLKLQKIEEEIEKLQPVVEENYSRAVDIQQFAEDPDDVMMGVGMYWNNYFGEDKQLYHTDQNRQELANKVASHAFSIASLSASLLQHAKQGISLAHGGLANCPSGRIIGSQSLKNIVWEARNQSLHWEEANFRQGVNKCFNALDTEVDQKYSQYLNRNMAFDIVDLLGWKSYGNFSRDLLSLA